MIKRCVDYYIALTNWLGYLNMKDYLNIDENVTVSVVNVTVTVINVNVTVNVYVNVNVSIQKVYNY